MSSRWKDRKGNGRAIAVGVIAVVLTAGTAAVAAPIVTSKDVKNDSIRSADVRDGTLLSRDIRNGGIRGAKDLKRSSVSRSRLSGELRRLLNQLEGNLTQGLTGPQGPAGPAGPRGPMGPAGPAGGDGTTGGAAGATTNPNWGTIFRNTIGSPDIDLADGPNLVGSPTPFGVGSLTFQVADGVDAGTADAEAMSFGNEVDFRGQELSGISQLGFRVFTTGENTARGNPNMPNINIEIDPNLGSTPSNFSTLVYMPPQSPSNQWSGYIDATTTPASPTGTGFRLTGAAGTATGCTLADPCTFAEVQDALDDDGETTKIGSVAVAKGRDFAFQGAVDGLRVNNEVMNFEAEGTIVQAP